MAKKNVPVGTQEKNQIDDSTFEKLLSNLKEYPQSRRILSKKMGVSDRALRKAIEGARLQGIPICSNSQTDGYWLGSSADIRHTIAEYEARGLRALEVARKMKARQLQGQTKIEM